MTDFETLLVAEQHNPNAAILQFFLSKYDAEEIVVLVEGDDDLPFYYDFIASYFPDKSRFFFPCGGKASVIELKKFLLGYKLDPVPVKLLALADKDFDDYLHRLIPDVFQTEFYSIENYFCSAQYFDYVLRKYASQQVPARFVEQLVAQFSSHLDSAVRLMVVPMAFLCALREKNGDADYDSISCADFLWVCPITAAIHSKRGARAHTVAQLANHNSLSVEYSSLRRFTKAFSQDNFNRWLRGKYALQMMRLVIRVIGHQNERFAAPLQKISLSFGVDAVRHAKEYLNDIPELKLYCVG